jgi:hypothetical protein
VRYREGGVATRAAAEEGTNWLKGDVLDASPDWTLVAVPAEERGMFRPFEQGVPLVEIYLLEAEVQEVGS